MDVYLDNERAGCHCLARQSRFGIRAKIGMSFFEMVAGWWRATHFDGELWALNNALDGTIGDDNGEDGNNIAEEKHKSLEQHGAIPNL